MNKFRIIYDYKLSKLENQFYQIRYFFKDYTKYIYNYSDKSTIDNTKFEYNIYLDVIQEFVYNNFPCNKTILIVNDEYLENNVQYLRREIFEDKPLVLLSNIVNYYICVTKKSYKLLIKNGIKKGKIILLEGFVKDNYDKILIPKQNIKKYILFELDKYSKQDNNNILNTWLKNFTDMNTILIIKYYYGNELIMRNLGKLIKQIIDESKLYFYKNIIIFKEDSFLKEYDIQYVILNSSYYEFIVKLYEHVLKNRLIITDEKDISVNILKYHIPLDVLNNKDSINKFDHELLTSNANKNLNKYMKKTIKIINKKLN